MVSTNEVKALILDFLVNTADIPSSDIPNGDIKFASLNIDSLTLIEMLGEIEGEYGIQIPQNFILKDITIDGMVAYIVELLSAGKSEGRYDTMLESEQ
ncbi:acyl carrier protein [Methylobacter sp.]|jgi:acyl carrier protein|uniref:acyl carrier protein n=1 Tax=Methylobacter sp. TaxID=2051955 RepID=UPI003DA36152